MESDNMDPTTAPEAVAQTVSVIDLVMQGWYVTYPLIAMSVMVTSILIERLWVMRGMASLIDSVTENACEALAAGDATGASGGLEPATVTSPAGRVFAPLVPLLGTTSVDDL